MFKDAPRLYTLRELVDLGTDPEDMVEHPTGNWVPSRYMGDYRLLTRIRLAIGVFTGKYDAVKWPGGQ